MSKYLIYTAEGQTLGPNSDVDVENCQILGTIEGVSESEAINDLFEQNDWIKKAGFTVDNAKAYQLLT